MRLRDQTFWSVQDGVEKLGDPWNKQYFKKPQ